MAALTAAELHGLAGACGLNAAQLIAEAVSNAGTAGVVSSDSGALQLGSNSTDLITIVGLLLEQGANAVTAFATGGQTSATQLTGNINRISTCATAGDSVKLPLAAAGATVIVINDGAAAAQVFGKTTDTINSIATATGVPLPAGAIAIFFATTTLNWRATLLSQNTSGNAAISTAGAGTLTAAGIVGGVITRTGPSAAFTDTTDTAVAIVAARPITRAGETFDFVIKNTTAFTETLAAGAGVTLSGQGVVPPNSVGRFRVTLTSVTAVAIQGIHVGPMTTSPLEVSTALSTVGAGTITAAGIAGGVTNRTGSTAAFTDTTDTGTNLQAAMPNANVGQSFEWTYYNNTAGPATITGDTGVTVSVVTIVPQGMWATYLVTMTAAATFTVVGVKMGPCLSLPNSKYTTAALSSTTASAGQLTGAANVFMNNSGATPGTYTTRTGAQMAADLPGIPIGFSYTLFLTNGQATGTLTLAAGASGVTITGTATMAGNVGRIYQVTYTAASTFVFQNVGSFTAP